MLVTPILATSRSLPLYARSCMSPRPLYPVPVTSAMWPPDVAIVVTVISFFVNVPAENNSGSIAFVRKVSDLSQWSKIIFHRNPVVNDSLTRLVTADDINASQSLNGGQLLHYGVTFRHSHDSEGQGHSHDYWQTWIMNLARLESDLTSDADVVGPDLVGSWYLFFMRLFSKYVFNFMFHNEMRYSGRY